MSMDILVPFYDLRTQTWRDYFQLDGSVIRPLTPEGRVTVKILRLNDAATSLPTILKNSAAPSPSCWMRIALVACLRPTAQARYRQYQVC